MIKYKLIKTAQIMSTFNAMANTSLPVTLAYRITKIMRKLMEEGQTFDAVRQAMCEKYGQYDENGNLKADADGMLVVKDDLIWEFRKEYEDLAALEGEINIPKLNLTELEMAGVKITPAELVTIEDFIEE